MADLAAAAAEEEEVVVEVGAEVGAEVETVAEAGSCHPQCMARVAGLGAEVEEEEAAAAAAAAARLEQLVVQVAVGAVGGKTLLTCTMQEVDLEAAAARL